MESMPVSVFKAKCLEVVGDIQRTGHPVMLTQKGEPAAIILPASAFFRASGYQAGVKVDKLVCPPREEWDLVS